MVAAVHALHGCLLLLHSRVPAHVPGDDVWLLPEAEGAYLDFWHAHFRCVNGGSVCGVCTSVGTDVLLGRAGHHFTLWRNPRDR